MELVRCDRCKQEIAKSSLRNVVSVNKYNGFGTESEHDGKDLCAQCSTDFSRFMNNLDAFSRRHK